MKRRAEDRRSIKIATDSLFTAVTVVCAVHATQGDTVATTAIRRVSKTAWPVTVTLHGPDADAVYRHILMWASASATLTKPGRIIAFGKSPKRNPPSEPRTPRR